MRRYEEPRAGDAGLLEDRDSQVFSKNRRKSQSDFARAIAAAEGPQESRQSWQYVAQHLAREPHDDSAFTAALRRALAELGGA